MKHLAVKVFIFSLVLIISACVPNRLEKSLEAGEAGDDTQVIIAPTPNGRNLQPQLGNSNINLSEVVTLLPPDAIPAIFPDEVSTIMVTAAESDEAGMMPEGRVLGVSVNGDSRAYPIPFMSEHEIVNDEVGGKLLAATW